MKQTILTLMVALMAMAAGAQKVYAEPTEDLVITVKTGLTYEASEDSEIGMAITLLILSDQLKFSDYNNSIQGFASKEGKDLFIINSKNMMIVCPNVTEDDDITYTITEDDREMLKGMGDKFHAFFQPYKTVTLHFVEDKIDLIATIREGMPYDDEDEVFFALGLMNLCNQLLFDKDVLAYTSMDGKPLFTITEAKGYHIYPNVTEADDISHTITETDLEKLKDISYEYYVYFLPYNTVTLHFESNQEIMEDYVITIKDGMEFDPENDPGVLYLYALIMLEQLKVEEMNVGMIISSKDDKELFIINDDSITIAPGVTSDDDFSYTITDEDLEKLYKTEANAAAFIGYMGFRTVTLHFETSQENKEDLVCTIKDGMDLEYLGKDFELSVYSLCMLEQLKMEEAENGTTISSKEGKVLFYINNDGITIASGVTSEDDICYTLTNEDYKKLNSIDDEFTAHLYGYKTLQLHFDVDNKENLVFTIKDGMDIKYMEDFEIPVYSLCLLEQLKMEETEEEITFVSKENKVLFVLKNNIISIAPGVTSDDDINYTITDADREKLKEIDNELAKSLNEYKSILLHFDVAVPGDMNKDGKFDIEDITWMIAAYLSSETEADLDGDGQLTIDDITQLIEMYLQK